MTSSLVGSEMCIRDSLTVVSQWSINSFLDGEWYDTPTDLPVATSLSSICPVSYTHLTLPTICSV
eukprot:2192724-Prorocentrum_lima.AAC.1